MRRIAIISLLSVTMMMSAVTHAFAQEKAESATETAVETSLYDGLTFNDAVEIALKDAGLEEDAVKFSKKMHSVEDGHLVYEISFIVPGEAKYAYEINANGGKIASCDSNSLYCLIGCACTYSLNLNSLLLPDDSCNRTCYRIG